MSVFVNRILNMKKIKAIGFDMDYTLVRYQTEKSEEFTFHQIKQKLVSVKGYPEEVLKLPFDFQRSIQGLIIDKKRGNLLKVSRFGKVKQSVHGITPLRHGEQHDVYRNCWIDLNDPNFHSLDPAFSISHGVAFGELVALKDKGYNLPHYPQIAEDIKACIDLCHRDGSFKNEILHNIEKYIIQDPGMVEVLENFKRFGKKLLIITNSDYSYSKLLLDYAINPFLKEHGHWSEVFELVITLSQKPGFFTRHNGFLRIDPLNGTMTNHHGKLRAGIYQGGSADYLQEDLALEGDEILYLGDHIYGDVVAIKKTCNWRTALVIDPLEPEIRGLNETSEKRSKIEELMLEKRVYELRLDDLDLPKGREQSVETRAEVQKLFSEMDKINQQISELIKETTSSFNPYWGEMMRAGVEESRLSDQVEKYACLYMARVSDFTAHHPRTYFRPVRRTLPHET
mgnify:CR=1 FL=1